MVDQLRRPYDFHDSSILEKNPAVINANTTGNFSGIYTSVIARIFLYANVLPVILSFVLMYAGRTFPLGHHSKRLGNIKYWVLICLPFIAGLLPTILALPSGGFTFYNKNLVTYDYLLY